MSGVRKDGKKLGSEYGEGFRRERIASCTEEQIGMGT